MAIDDNTLYGLTGAQVKELPEKIEAVKGLAKALTTADYNWPTTGTATSVALWLLEDGYYTCGDSSVVVRPDASTPSISPGAFLIGGATGRKMVFYLAPDGSTRRLYSTQTSDGASLAFYNLLGTNNVVDSLTSTAATLPLSANQGKVLKDTIDSIAIRGTGAPTTSTVGQVGTLYEDTTNGKLYICTDTTNPYVWEEVGSGGGSGPTVVQTTGTSTTDVMSQNAVTSMVFADPATQYKIKIGAGTSTSEGQEGIEIGHNATARGTQATAIGDVSDALGSTSVALGHAAQAYANEVVSIGSGTTSATNAYFATALGAGASVYHRGSVALGSYSTTTGIGQVNIGPTLTNAGYNNSNYRLLTGLYDPQSAHDAATKGYVDTAVAGAGASAFTTNEWNALWA